jgi:chromosome partitioning protein
VFRRFKGLNPEMGFAESLGVIVNMKDKMSAAEDEYHRWLMQNPQNNCFEHAIPRANAMQEAAKFREEQRSYAAKYPGEAGTALQGLAKELLARLAKANAATGARPERQIA